MGRKEAVANGLHCYRSRVLKTNAIQRLLLQKIFDCTRDEKWSAGRQEVVANGIFFNVRTMKVTFVLYYQQYSHGYAHEKDSNKQKRRTLDRDYFK